MECTIISAACLDQWAMDFEGNQERILESIKEAKLVHNARIRLGPELEVPGYSSEDHFYELDTILHSWMVAAEVIKLTSKPPYNDILCQVGMPINHRGILYNCSLSIYCGKVYLIRPKQALAEDGNYREGRWFTPWTGGNILTDYALPGFISNITGQRLVPFGNALLRSEEGYLIGTETCEELWCPLPHSTNLLLQGAHIILNSSGSHFNLRKLHNRKDLIRSATVKTGGVYVYSNCRGCDGGRLYFDGACMIALNGNFLKIGSQFNLKDVDVISAKIDLSEVNNYRVSELGWTQARLDPGEDLQIIQLEGFRLVIQELREKDNPMLSFHDLSPEEQIAYAPACYLWDYLRRSEAQGYFLPLSGGSDSSSTLAIIGIMCQMVMSALNEETGYNLKVVQNDVTRLCGRIPDSAKSLAFHILSSAYLCTRNSSDLTRSRAQRLAEEVGCHHTEVNIDKMVDSIKSTYIRMTRSKEPRFIVHGGSIYEDLALQNIQARTRMLTSYLLGQLLTLCKKQSGFLLVLGSANLEEGLTGYMTKYDCSSADINPIGGISKEDLKRFLRWAALNKGYQTLIEIVEAPPTAELRPNEGEVQQTDEEDLGLTYKEISLIGKIRKVDHCGPYFVFMKLISEEGYNPREAAQKVKRFFWLYAKNRHKMTVVTPAVHIETYSADDNRFDMRNFIYNTKWEIQFEEIDKLLAKLTL